MFLFIIAVLALLVGIGGFVVGLRGKEPVGFLVGIVALIAAGVALFFSTFYAQDPGEARVLRSFTGEVVGSDVTAGADFKAPWVSLEDFDIRNQPAAFLGDGNVPFNGGLPNGPQITTTDAEGATLNIDIVVNYSIRPDKVVEVYENYQTQANFVARFIEQDVRSVVRNVPNGFSTLDVLTQRGTIQTAIEEALRDRWASTGVEIQTVALQEIRYSDEVRSSFDAAQQARINVETEEANLDAAEVRAQTRVAEATAQAEANRILTESLSPEVLQQRYFDTLADVGAGGNLVIVPEGFNGLVNVSPTP